MDDYNTVFDWCLSKNDEMASRLEDSLPVWTHVWFKEWMLRAVSDCHRLDHLDGGEAFLRQFAAALESEQAEEEILRRVAIGENRNYFKNVRESAGKPSYLRHLAIYKVREILRDTYDEEQAIRLASEYILKFTKEGDAAFFEALGGVLAEHRKAPLQRSATEWIKRAWLPLALWQCPNAGAARSRCLKAARVLGIAGGLPKLDDLPAFSKVWSNARASIYRDLKAP